jgi:hypothetical protein
MTHTTSLVSAAQAILEQLENLVQQLSDEAYTTPAVCLHNATLGQHLRHTLEFFLCFSQGTGDGAINYDRRAHSRALETRRALAIETIASIRAFLAAPPPDRPLVLQVSYNPHDDTPVSMPTHFFRELVYNIEHAVHHMALIKIGLSEVAPHVAVPRSFGVAVSTLRHQNQTAVAQ